jgi:uncharacterized protein (TIGR03435 family)
MAAILDHLWQSTIVAGGLGLLTLAFRNHRAHVRHGLWLVASLKFFVPFAVLVAVGSQLGWREVPSRVPAPIAAVIGTIGQPSSIMPVSSGAPAQPVSGVATSWLILTFLAIWIAGAVALIAAWTARWRRMTSIVCDAVPADECLLLDAVRRVESQVGVRPALAVVVSDASFEPGVFGILRPILVWPRQLSSHLDAGQIESIVRHELVHVRRRDNLTAAAHMAVQAVFWFHPLVWWIGARLVGERERACDEAVVLMGSDPQTYAESILKTCRRYVGAPLACMAGVTGSNLDTRIRHIMASDARRALTSWSKAAFGVAALAVVVVPLAVGVMNAPLRAQAPDRSAALPTASDSNTERRVAEMKKEMDDLAAAVERMRRMYRESSSQQPAPRAARPAFDVTSVKRNKSGDNRIMMLPAANGGWSATNVTLGMLIRIAYQIQDSQIAGGPKWLYDDRFDVVGTGNAPGAPLSPLFEKLQALLADRFGLMTHMETRELPMFDLVIASRDRKTGPKLHPSSATDCPVPPAPGAGRGPAPQPMRPDQMQVCGIMLGPGRLSSGHLTIETFAANLSRLIGSIVVDKTGLDGYYDLSLEYAQDASLAGRSDFPGGRPPELDRPASDGPSIFAALQEQLGLKLESKKGPVSVLVIDKAEQPQDN